MPAFVVLEFPGYPVGARKRNTGHRRRFNRQRHEIFRFEIVNVALAACPGDGLAFERQYREIIGKPAPGFHRIEPCRQDWILRGDARRITAFVPIVVRAGRGAELPILGFEAELFCADAAIARARAKCA